MNLQVNYMLMSCVTFNIFLSWSVEKIPRLANGVLHRVGWKNFSIVHNWKLSILSLVMAYFGPAKIHKIIKFTQQASGKTKIQTLSKIKDFPASLWPHLFSAYWIFYDINLLSFQHTFFFSSDKHFIFWFYFISLSLSVYEIYFMYNMFTVHPPLNATSFANPKNMNEKTSKRNHLAMCIIHTFFFLLTSHKN